MRNISSIILLIAVIFSCKQKNNISEPSSTKSEISNSLTRNEDVEEILPIEEVIFITMERTPCFGKCPAYKLTIFNTGKVNYEGFDFAPKQGKYHANINKEQIDELKNNIKLINLFNLKDKYDYSITDIPSCILYVQLDGKKKKILDRYGAPKELRDFENLIDSMIDPQKLIKNED